MFLRCKVRKKNGKKHRSWSLVENRRAAGGRVVQRHVLYLGEINDSQQLAWRKSVEMFRESRRDELLHAQDLLAQGKTIKPNLERFFNPRGRLLATQLTEAEEFDGYSCIFCTRSLPENQM